MDELSEPAEPVPVVRLKGQQAVYPQFTCRSFIYSGVNHVTQLSHFTAQRPRSHILVPDNSCENLVNHIRILTSEVSAMLMQGNRTPPFSVPIRPSEHSCCKHQSPVKQCCSSASNTLPPSMQGSCRFVKLQMIAMNA